MADKYVYPGTNVLINKFNCLKCGYVLDLTKTKHEEMLEASVRSFNTGDNSGFIEIFNRCVIPEEEYLDYQRKLSASLLALSEDD